MKKPRKQTKRKLRLMKALKPKTVRRYSMSLLAGVAANY